MTFKEKIEALFGFASPTYYRWKKEKRPIVELIENSFTEQELELFLQTNEIPYKIQFANKYFAKLNNEFTTYIIEDKGIKALMSALLLEKNVTLNNLNSAIISQYEKKNINQIDLTMYFDNQPSEQLKLYIFENYNQDWKLYLNSVDQYGQGWIKIYFEIMQLSIEKNIYDKIFSNTNKNIDYSAMPNISGKFTSIINPNNEKYKRKKFSKNRDIKLFERYVDLISNIKNAIVSDTYDDLDAYNYFDEFSLDIEPAEFDIDILPPDEIETLKVGKIKVYTEYINNSHINNLNFDDTDIYAEEFASDKEKI
jgi:hypothetical protein